jgi:hypothetical protein
VRVHTCACIIFSAPRLKELEAGTALSGARTELAGIVSKHCPRVAKFIGDFYAHPVVAGYYAAKEQEKSE